MRVHALITGFRLMYWRSAIIVLCLLAGCAGSAVKQPQSKLTGALLVLRLEGRFDAPALVEIEVELTGTGKRTSVVGELRRNFPGSHADYLITLPLAPARYALSSLRESTGALPADAGRALPLNLGFEVRDRDAPDYIGRLVIAPGSAPDSPRLSIDDRYEEDSLLFRTSVDRLRNITIGRNVQVASLPPPPSIAPPPAPIRADLPVAAASGPHLDLKEVTAAAALKLPPPTRAPFARYLKLKSPRAFAVSDSGAHGIGSGPGAIATAIRQCVQRSKGGACRLVAVDESLVTEGFCSPGGRTTPGGLGTGACVAPQALP
jgi:hypothetical protein